MSSPEIDRRLFETLIQSAVVESHQQEMSALPSEEELAVRYAFSSGFDPQIRRLLRRNRRASRLRSLKLQLAKTAALAAVIMVLTLGGMLLVPDVRATVMNAVVHWLDTNADFRFAPEAPRPASWRPSYLPEGFYEAEVTINDEVTRIIYQDDREISIRYYYAPAQEGYLFSIDNENSDYTQVYFDGILLHVFQAQSAEEYSYVIWEQEALSFRLMSTIHSEELLKMAQSVIESK